MVRKINFEPQLVLVEHNDRSAVSLTDRQKLSLYKKSQNSGYSVNILEEVYRRGYTIWDESVSGSAEQFAFDRVNSFVAGGFALDLDKDLLEEKEVWEKPNPKAGRSEKLSSAGKAKAKARAKAAGRPYPNMVDNIWAARNEETNKNNPENRFVGTDSLVDIYTNDTPGQKETTLKTIKRVVNEATYKGKKVTLNKPFRTPGGPKKSAVYVDPDGDGKAKVVRFGDPKLSIKKDQPARKRSYCARSSGQGNLTKKDSANYWSRKMWDC
jgi:hypothetical protein